jgi:hypothetical protein
VIYDAADLLAALSLLENNGEQGTYDTGALPGLPYILRRPIPDAWPGPSWLQPTPPQPHVLKHLRPD